MTVFPVRDTSTGWAADAIGIREASTMLTNAGALSEGFAGIQYDLNATWRRLSTGREINASLCDHNCTIEVNGEATGGNYVCPASLSLNHGVSKKWLIPVDLMLGSIATLGKGVERARARFFNGRFEAYCEDFGIPPAVAGAMRETLNKPVLEVNLFGGNPEMYPQITTVIRELRGAGHRVHFTTTGRRFIRDREFVADITACPPTMIALSADDFDDADHIHRLAELAPEQLLSEWKSVNWRHGQRQKAYEAVYVAKLAAASPEFPSLLFNMVLHPGNLAGARAIVTALAERFPGAKVNPFPAQSAFLNDGGEPALRAEHAATLRDLVDDILRDQTAAVRAGRQPSPYVARLHYWLMLQAVFDAAGDRDELAMNTIVGDGIWRCYQSSAAGRYLQVGAGVPSESRMSQDQHPGGHLGCFWNNETVTKTGTQIWDLAPASVATYVDTEKQALGASAAKACPGCAFPRLTYDMLATETGMRTDLVPFYRRRREDAFGF